MSAAIMHRLGVIFIGGLIGMEILGCATHNGSIRSAAGRASVTAPTLHCKSFGGLSDHACTPGVVRTTSVQSICHGGSTKQYRPPTSYTNNLKVQQIAEYGYTDTNPKDYEEDHLISLEIGGDGSDPKNLWPEAHAGKYGSFTKDRVENWLHKQICSGAMTPEEAQKGIATDWRQYIPQVLASENKPAR
jgi:hypothetical protein